ncbi:MAG: carboxypeptidase regulatory-like domain-containing protein [Pirellulales bacterium]|nr:carboxypeptidase regulatory-like domain-containing protein [Pirellulales bacterium]
MASKHILISLGLLIALIAGCGPKLPPLGTVHGQVTLDGKPVPNADICFLASDGASSFGCTDAEGRYKLSYPLRKGKNAGAMIGKHRVMINTIRPNDGSLPTPAVPPIQIPARYNSKTTLTADVKQGDNEINFHIKSE